MKDTLIIWIIIAGILALLLILNYQLGKNAVEPDIPFGSQGHTGRY